MAAKTADAVLAQGRQTLRCCQRVRAPRRAFSSTPSRRRAGHVPQFVESEGKPELNALLAKVRSNLFLPGYLKEEQRKLMYKSKHHAMLLNEPFYVDVGDESFQLLPLNPTKDIPGRWRSCSRAMKLMGDSARDWQNLVPLLEGIKVSRNGKDLKDWEQTYISKVAAVKGMAYILLDAVRAADRTGLRLRDVRVAREVIWACRSLAYLGEWDEVSTEKALRYALQISNLMDEDTHCGAKDQVSELFAQYGDPRRQPDIIGAVLELAAVRASKYPSSTTQGPSVQSLLERLLTNIDATTNGTKASGPVKQTHRMVDADYQLERWVPVLGGLQEAKAVLGTATPQSTRVDDKIQELRERTRTWRATLAREDADGNKPRRGAEWFDELDA